MIDMGQRSDGEKKGLIDGGEGEVNDGMGGKGGGEMSFCGNGNDLGVMNYADGVG